MKLTENQAKRGGVSFGETLMCSDYSVGERGTGGQGQADVTGQRPVPGTLSLSLSLCPHHKFAEPRPMH